MNTKHKQYFHQISWVIARFLNAIALFAYKRQTDYKETRLVIMLAIAGVVLLPLFSSKDNASLEVWAGGLLGLILLALCFHAFIWLAISSVFLQAFAKLLQPWCITQSLFERIERENLFYGLTQNKSFYFVETWPTFAETFPEEARLYQERNLRKIATSAKIVKKAKI